MKPIIKGSINGASMKEAYIEVGLETPEDASVYIGEEVYVVHPSVVALVESLPECHKLCGRLATHKTPSGDFICQLHTTEGDAQLPYHVFATRFNLYQTP